MKDFQKVGGVGAFLQAAFFVMLFVYIFVVLPSQGLAGPTALNDPAKALPFAANSPILSLVNLIFVPLVIGIILVVLALYERFKPVPLASCELRQPLDWLQPPCSLPEP